MFAVDPLADRLASSPFAQYAKADPTVNEYMLRNMFHSWAILKAIVKSETNYFTEFEEKARKQPELAKQLYEKLRDEMNCDPKKHKDVWKELDSIDLHPRQAQDSSEETSEDDIIAMRGSDVGN